MTLAEKAYGLTAPAQGVVLLASVARGDTTDAVVAGAGLGLMMLGPKATAVVAAGAIVLGALPVAAVATANVVLYGLKTVMTLACSYDIDMELLAGRVSELPPVLLPVGLSRTLTTDAFLDAARAARPNLWSVKASLSDAATIQDGPLLEVEPPAGPCTLYAAEAVSLALVASETLNVALDIHLLGAAAVMIPGSSAAARVYSGSPGAQMLRVTGAHELQLVEVLRNFTRDGSGGDVLRRMGPEGIKLSSFLDLISLVSSEAVHKLRTRWRRRPTNPGTPSA
ncbi:MAG: hypothetical protein ACR2KK_08935 [Acidimicrobiales bacterium]